MTDEDRTGHLGDAITALLDGELSDEEAVVARRHLAECPACTAQMAALGQIRSWLRDLPPVEPPADFFERILDLSGDLNVHAVTTTARSRRWAGVGALVGCAAATLVVLGLATPREPPTSPPVAHFIEAHATAAGGEPVSHLAPAVVPVSFRR